MVRVRCGTVRTELSESPKALQHKLVPDCGNEDRPGGSEEMGIALAGSTLALTRQS